MPPIGPGQLHKGNEPQLENTTHMLINIDPGNPGHNLKLQTLALKYYRHKIGPRSGHVSHVLRTENV